MHNYLREARPKNWLKNTFVLIPIVFSLELTEWCRLLSVVLLFIGFCFISSAVYVYNDIIDADKDAIHPVKCKRPIAAGIIPKSKAYTYFVFLLVVGCSFALYVSMIAFVLFITYILVNIAYSLYLKNQPILDCFCIATGFVLRVFVGGVPISNGVSDWLFMTIVAMSLFMAFGKRRGEAIKTSGNSTRPVLENYNLGFLNGMVFICAGLAIVFYSLWSMTRGRNMIYTVPLIIFIVSKYLLLIFIDSFGDPTTVILSNKTLIFACGAYALLTIALLYL